MSVLTVTDLSEETVSALARRAQAHGVALEVEARRVLEAAVSAAEPSTANAEEAVSFKEHLLNFPAIADEDLWMFDRHDPRNVRPEREPIDFGD